MQKLAPLMLLLALGLALAAARLAGFTAYVVASASMEPNVPAGSVVIVQPASPGSVRVGDVITFSLPDRVVTHRVASVATTDLGITFTTRGDANTIADPWVLRADGDVGAVRLAIPLLGFVVAMAQAWWRLLAVGFIAWVGADAALTHLRNMRHLHRIPHVARS